MNTNLTDRPNPKDDIGYCPICGRTLEVYNEEIEVHYTPKYHSHPSAEAEARYANVDQVTCPTHGTFIDGDYPTSTHAEDHPTAWLVGEIFTAIEAAAPHTASRTAIATMLADADANDSPSRLLNLAGALHHEAVWNRAYGADLAARMYHAAAGACEDLAAYLADFPNRDDADAAAAARDAQADKFREMFG